MSAEEQIILKLNQIIERLDRMEARQVQIKENIKEQPVQGSFASTDQ